MAAPGDMDVNGDLIGAAPVHRCHKELEPGDVCGCGYRKPYPKTDEAPESVPRSFRGPTDSMDKFNENLYVASQIVGIPAKEKYAAFKFFDWMLAQVISKPELYEGAYMRSD